jgi:hypothetical protein
MSAILGVRRKSGSKKLSKSSGRVTRHSEGGLSLAEAIPLENKLGLYRQCVGARIGGGMRRNMFADALLIQPVVLSRGTVMPTMGIECSGAVGGGCGWWYSQGLACLPGLLEVDGRVNRGRRTPLKRDSGVAETHE